MLPRSPSQKANVPLTSVFAPMMPAPGKQSFSLDSIGNRALQAYQMKLKMLEQQNKKRLKLARREWEPYLDHDPDRKQIDDPAAATQPNQEYQDHYQDQPVPAQTPS